MKTSLIVVISIPKTIWDFGQLRDTWWFIFVLLLEKKKSPLKGKFRKQFGNIITLAGIDVPNSLINLSV